MADKIDTYELVIGEASDEVFAISLVDEPAIEADFLFFNAVDTQDVVEFSAIDNERRIVAGPVLIPDIEILRKDEEGNFYNVYFSKDTVSQLAHQFVKSKKSDAVTLQHTMMANEINLIESWVIEDNEKDKSNTFGFSLPNGTWFAIMKIENEKVWSEFVKTGKLRGFSVEVKISKVKQNLKKQTNMADKKQENITTDEKSRLTSILERIENIFSKNEKVEMQEDKEKKEDMKGKEDKEKMEEKKVTEEMVNVELPEPMEGNIFIPEELEDESVEIEAHDKTYIVHVYIKQTEPVEQDDRDLEPANPDTAVVDELAAVKNELAELKKFVDSSPNAEKFSKTEDGLETNSSKELNVKEIMAFAKKGMKR